MVVIQIVYNSRPPYSRVWSLTSLCIACTGRLLRKYSLVFSAGVFPGTNLVILIWAVIPSNQNANCLTMRDLSFWLVHFNNNVIKSGDCCHSLSLLYSIMTAPSTTTYYPFDSDAPQVFSSTQTENWVAGEPHLSWLTSSFWSYLRASRIHCTESFNKESLLMLTNGHSVGVAALWSRYHSGQGGMMSVL